MVSGFKEIHVSRTWRVYSATGFDLREKNRAGLGSIGAVTLPSVSYVATICREDDDDDVMKTVRDTNSEPGLPVVRRDKISSIGKKSR